MSRLRCLRYAIALAAGIALLLTMRTAAVATENPQRPLVDVVHGALEAWSAFATSGDLSLLRPSFVLDGPQWRQLEAESSAFRQSRGGASLHMDTREVRLRRLDSNTATVWVEVEASRVGFVSQVFSWDFDLLRDNGRWLVWTVVPAERPANSAQDTSTAVPDSNSITTTTTTAQRSMPEPEAAAVSAGSSTGTRIPVLSAWIVVVTVVGVAVAGYMAPRFDRGSEG